MANLTITLDDDLLRRARVRAAQEGTSVNAVLREHLETWAGEATRRGEAVASLLRLSQRARSGRGKKRWTRDDLHER
jgi:plasmid stability protein